MDTKEKLTLDAIQAMLQTMLTQQKDMRSDNRKVREWLEIATPIRARETQCILFNELEEEAAVEGSTCANKGKTKDENLESIKMKIPAF